MRKLIVAAVLLLPLLTKAQVDTSKVYPVAEYMPMIANCAALDTTELAKRQCSQEILLRFIYQNVQYPDSARLQGVEGTVVVSFIVKPDSLIEQPKIMRDIGAGCGESALVVINALNSLGVKWAPGRQDGVPVKVRMNIPVKFKLKEVPPYDIIQGDTIYNQFTKALAFRGGDSLLYEHLYQTITYPAIGNDSCAIGAIDLKALVQKDGVVRILEMSDYCNLGTEFQFEAISAITSTIGKWEIAEYDSQTVSATYPIRLDFIPTADHCSTAINNFEKAQQIALEGTTLFNSGETEAGIAKLSEAITLMPNNAEYLYARGNAYLELKDYPAACEDLQQVKEVLFSTWIDQLLPVICK